jgi:hypothetical protein
MNRVITKRQPLILTRISVFATSSLSFRYFSMPLSVLLRQSVYSRSKTWLQSRCLLYTALELGGKIKPWPSVDFA